MVHCEEEVERGEGGENRGVCKCLVGEEPGGERGEVWMRVEREGITRMQGMLQSLYSDTKQVQSRCLRLLCSAHFKSVTSTSTASGRQICRDFSHTDMRPRRFHAQQRGGCKGAINAAAQWNVIDWSASKEDEERGAG